MLFEEKMFFFRRARDTHTGSRCDYRWDLGLGENKEEHDQRLRKVSQRGKELT